MNELRSEVIALADIEMERSKEKCPAYNSDHEGISIIRDCLHDAKGDMERLKYIVDRLEEDIFAGYPVSYREEECCEAEREAIELACEAIRTAAALHKFNDSHVDQDETEVEADHKKEFWDFIETLFDRNEKEEKNA